MEKLSSDEEEGDEEEEEEEEEKEEEEEEEEDEEEEDLELELLGAGGGSTDASGEQATTVAPAAWSTRAGLGVPGSLDDDEEVRRRPRRDGEGCSLPVWSPSAALASALGGGHRLTSSQAPSSPAEPVLK